MKSPKIPELLEKINLAAKDADFSKLSKLEYDLLMQNIRDLYESIDIARKPVLTEQQGVAAPVKKRLLNPNEGMLISEPVINTVQEVKTIAPVIETKPIVDPVVVKKEEPKIQAVVNPEVKPKENALRSTINELVQTGSSLNEKLKAGSNEVHRKLSTRPLKDLIDLNKKFVLLNDLFKGNTEAFSAAIQHIDSVSDLASAEIFIKNELSSNYFWDETSQSVRMFRKLVKQKFGEE